MLLNQKVFHTSCQRCFYIYDVRSVFHQSWAKTLIVHVTFLIYAAVLYLIFPYAFWSKKNNEVCSIQNSIQICYKSNIFFYFAVKMWCFSYLFCNNIDGFVSMLYNVLNSINLLHSLNIVIISLLGWTSWSKEKNIYRGEKNKFYSSNHKKNCLRGLMRFLST